jgi:hypothetical protein
MYLKEKVIELVKFLGDGLNEIIFDFLIDDIKFNSIEYIPDENILNLHIFHKDLDYCCDFDGMDENKQDQVYKILLYFIN